jgi:hypothetical protein
LIKEVPGGVQVGEDRIVFKGTWPDSDESSELISITRSGKKLLALSGKEIDSDRWQGEIGLFVPDAGYPFGEIPEWLIRQRANKPDWIQKQNLLQP